MAQQLPSELTVVTTAGRETSPPSGPAAPFSQYYIDADTPRAVQGENGALYTISAGYDGTNHQKILVTSAGRVMPVESRYVWSIVDDTTALAKDETSTVVLQATAGHFAYVYRFGFYAPIHDGGGSGSGKHTVNIYLGNTGTYTAQSMFTTFEGPSTEIISVQTQAAIASTGVITSNNMPMFCFGTGDQVARVVYTYNDAAGQTSTRKIFLGYVEVPSL